jgi:hypothetical protein
VLPADRRYLISLPNAVLLAIITVLIITCLLLYFRTSAPRGLLTIPVGDRVRGVVLTWSQDTSLADGDKLETIWGRTRTSGNHDYDYSPGGIYDLNRLLAVEFSHPPQKTIPPIVAFGSTGRIKTFADLVDAMQQ